MSDWIKIEDEMPASSKLVLDLIEAKIALLEGLYYE